MVTPLSCAPGNVHILSRHNRPSLETDLVLCDVSPRTLTCFLWNNWILEGKMVTKMGPLKKHSNVHSMYVPSGFYRNVISLN